MAAACLCVRPSPERAAAAGASAAKQDASVPRPALTAGVHAQRRSLPACLSPPFPAAVCCLTTACRVGFEVERASWQPGGSLTGWGRTPLPMPMPMPLAGGVGHSCWRLLVPHGRASRPGPLPPPLSPPTALQGCRHDPCGLGRAGGLPRPHRAVSPAPPANCRLLSPPAHALLACRLCPPARPCSPLGHPSVSCHACSRAQGAPSACHALLSSTCGLCRGRRLAPPPPRAHTPVWLQGCEEHWAVRLCAAVAPGSGEFFLSPCFPAQALQWPQSLPSCHPPPGPACKAACSPAGWLRRCACGRGAWTAAWARASRRPPCYLPPCPHRRRPARPCPRHPCGHPCPSRRPPGRRPCRPSSSHLCRPCPRCPRCLLYPRCHPGRRRHQAPLPRPGPSPLSPLPQAHAHHPRPPRPALHSRRCRPSTQAPLCCRRCHPSR